MTRKWIWGFSGLFLLLAGVLVYGLFFRPEPVLAVVAQTEIRASEALRQEIRYQCGDRKTIYTGTAGDYWQKALSADLRENPADPPNWHLSRETDGSLLVTQQLDRLCTQHQAYRHLGIWQDKLAVYEGPLGAGGKLLRQEKQQPLANLPPEMRQALTKAEKFAQLSPAEQEQCREQLEFVSEAKLNGVLENLDELH